MHADTLRIDRDALAIDRNQRAFLDHAHDMRQTCLGAVDHRPRLTARHEIAIVEVGPIGKDFLDDRQTQRLSGQRHL